MTNFTYFLEILYSFIGSFCFAIIFNIRIKKSFFAGIGGAVSQSGYIICTLFLGNEFAAYFLATIATALYAEMMARILKAPATVFLVPSIIPLVPGSLMYYSMEYLVTNQRQESLDMVLRAVTIASSLAMGILIVSSLIKIQISFKNLHKKIKKTAPTNKKRRERIKRLKKLKKEKKDY